MASRRDRGLWAGDGSSWGRLGCYAANLASRPGRCLAPEKPRQSRHRSPKSFPQVDSAGTRLPRPVVICRSAGRFFAAIGPLKGKGMICRERLRPLPSDRAPSRRRNPVIQRYLRQARWMMARVICRVARPFGVVSTTITMLGG